MTYDDARKKFEAKWQKEWEDAKLYEASDTSKKLKWYSLFEFPYPSGNGLHVGHLRPYIGMDVISRKRRMQGYNVLYPIGWDAFGLPTENYALKTGISPQEATKQNTDNFRRQMKAVGPSLDWSREIDTTDPEYYKWTQWMFLKFFERGMAYKAKTFINWCPKDKIGLANEEAAGGVCDRCGGPVEKREKEQWMLRITKYADRLLEGLKEVDYIPQAKTQQENWIGRSEGAEIEFPISVIANRQLAEKQSSSGSPRPQAGLAMTTDSVTVFTTRPDTIFGATYIVLSPEHSIIEFLKNKISNFTIVKRYIEETKRKGEAERVAEDKEKSGVQLEGIKAINPATKQEIPVWVADYILPQYGTGAIMAVPAHDERDFAFATKFKLPIRQVIKPKEIYKSVIVTETTEPGLKEALTTSGIKFSTALSRNKREHIHVLPQKKQIVRFIQIIQEFIKNDAWVEIIGSENILIFKNEVIKDFLRDDGAAIFEKLKNFEPLIRKFASIWEMLRHNLFYEELVCYIAAGTLVNSGKFDGMDSEKAKEEITKFVKGERRVQYKLRDWVFSRQRYWGEPIPLAFCPECKTRVEDYKLQIADNRGNSSLKSKINNLKYSEGELANPGWFAVADKDLPVKLPKVEKYQPTDTGESPLANIKDWVNVKCPKCKGPAKRETDTMPNWAGSSWYFLRYTDPHNNKEFASMKKLEYWMGDGSSRRGSPQDDAGGVDWYNGGMEHTVLHLLYSRFWNMFLYDLGLVPTSEPYKKRTSHGLVLAEGGVKMSKSKGNVINPDDLIKEFGADALRLYEMFMGPFDQAIAWDKRGILGTERFLKRVWELSQKIENRKLKVENERVVRLVHKTIKKVSEDIETMSFNTAVSALMILVNELSPVIPAQAGIQGDGSPIKSGMTLERKEWEIFLKILAPFAPHITEELWAQLGNKKSIHLEQWPAAEEKYLIEDTFELVIQVNGKTRDKVSAPMNIAQADAEKLAQSREETKKWMTGKLRKVIYVKNRLINFIV